MLLKKIFRTAFFALSFWAVSHAAMAQNAKAARTNAAVSLDAYTTDNSMRNELKNAREKIEIAIKDSEVGGDPKTWRYRATIYTAIAENEKIRAEFPAAALTGYESWLRALELEEAKLTAKNKPLTKIPSKSDYQDGFEACANALFNSGAEMLNNQGFTEAYPYFNAILQIPVRAKNVFGDKAPTYRFKEVDAKRIAGIATMKMGKIEEGEQILRPLLNGTLLNEEMGAAVYDAMTNSAIEAQQMIKARQYIAEGRKKYPTNQNLLRTEISLAIAENRLSEVEAQIKQAIEAAPNDAELIFVMGNLYDGLFRQKIRPAERLADLTALDEKTGLEYLQKANDYYTLALKANPKHYNSLYSLGVLQINYANYGYKKQEKAPKEPEWQKLSDAATEKSINYLLEAEKLDPTNKLALEALKSVYGIKGDNAKYEEYKAKIK
jgi:hypothetical protein